MPYIQVGDDVRIDPATSGDLERLFDDSRIFGVTVHQDANSAVKATVTGGSAIVLLLDYKNAKAKKPSGRVDRDGALAILKAYLEDGSLHSDYTWSDVDLPTVSTRKGCLNAAVVVVFMAILMLAIFSRLAT